MESTLKLLPIQAEITQNEAFKQNPLCQDSLEMTIAFYEKVGFSPPWICYYVEKDGVLVGNAAFKGSPINDTVEIAYATFEACRNQGVGTEICHVLVQLALETNPNIIIMARTLAEHNFSTKILTKNHFAWAGTVNDPEDGEVWEWVYQKQN